MKNLTGKIKMIMQIIKTRAGKVVMFLTVCIMVCLSLVSCLPGDTGLQPIYIADGYADNLYPNPGKHGNLGNIAYWWNEGYIAYVYSWNGSAWNLLSTSNTSGISSVDVGTPSNVNGILKGNGSHILTAVAGTDYLANINTGTATNITGLLKGNGSTLTSAVAGTDYLANVNTGTSTNLTGLLKGNGTNIQAATPGTDYVYKGGAEYLALPFLYLSIGQGTWTWIADTNQYYGGFWYNTTVTNLDNITYEAYLQSGNYTLDLCAMKNYNRGIATFKIDGNQVASFDLYNASAIYNYTCSQTNIVVTSGLKSLTWQVNGKNTSSSGYGFSWSVFRLHRTG